MISHGTKDNLLDTNPHLSRVPESPHPEDEPTTPAHETRKTSASRERNRETTGRTSSPVVSYYISSSAIHEVFQLSDDT